MMKKSNTPCTVRSMGYPLVLYEILYDYYTMYFSSACEIMRLKAYPWKQNCGKIDFCRFQLRDKVTRTCEKPWAESPANSDVTGVTFFYNLLEFSTPFDCKGSRMVYTSMLLICTKIIPGIYDLYLLNIYGFCVFPETKPLNFDFTKCKIPIPTYISHIPWHLLGKKAIPLQN